MTVGEKLKRERKKQKLSLERISEQTKISAMFLEALEDDDIDKLPGGIYSRNFLRAYATCLGMDPDIVTAEFHEQHNTKPTAVVHREQTSMDNRSYMKEKRRGLLLFFVLIVVVGVLSLGGYFVYQQWAPHFKPKSDKVFSFSTSSLEDENTIPGEGNETVSVTDSELQDDAESPDSTANNQQVIQESKDKVEPEPVNDHSAAAESSPEEAQQDLMPPVPVEPSWPTRPVLDVSSIRITNLPEDLDIAPDLKNLFFVFALKDVWLEVVIDGFQVTRRLVRAGDYRVYYYGQHNEITCGDFQRIGLQDGSSTVSTELITGGVRETVVFERGGLAQAVSDYPDTKVEMNTP